MSPCYAAHKSLEKKSPLEYVLYVTGVGAIIVGGHALWQAVRHTDSMADHLVPDLTICRWRERSLWLFGSSWWTGEQMWAKKKDVLSCLIKDLNQGYFVDHRGSTINTLPGLAQEIQFELRILQESKAAAYFGSVLNEVGSWITGKKKEKDETKRLTHEESIDRLIGRLEILKKIVATS